MQLDAKDLQFGDTIVFQGDTYDVIEATENDIGSINVLMKPTDGLGLDLHLAFPKPFCFETISRLM